MSDVNIRYPDDVKIIIEAYKEQDITLTEKEAQGLWYDYSDQLACGWCGGVQESSLHEIYEYTIDFLQNNFIIIEIHKSIAKKTDNKFHSLEKAESFLKIKNESYYKILDIS